MKKSVLIWLAFVAAAVCVGSRAHAQDIPQIATLPPAEYDHKYPGRLLVLHAKTEAIVRAWCVNTIFKTPYALGCQFKPADKKDYDCVIVLADPQVIAKYGWNQSIVERHERAHCNGWPVFHPGAHIPTLADYGQ